MHDFQTHHMLKFCLEECAALGIEAIFFDIGDEGEVFMSSFIVTKEKIGKKKSNKDNIIASINQKLETIDQEYIDRLWNLASRAGIGAPPTMTRRMIRDTDSRIQFFEYTLRQWLATTFSLNMDEFPEEAEILFNAQKRIITIGDPETNTAYAISSISNNGVTLDKLPKRNLGETEPKRMVISSMGESGKDLVWVH